MFPLTLAPTALDGVQIKADYPALHRSVHGQPLVFLDSAASSQKPVAVLDAMDALYRTASRSGYNNASDIEATELQAIGVLHWRRTCRTTTPTRGAFMSKR